MIDSHTNAKGQLQHCLTVPRMAVATALMELPPDIRSIFRRHDGGVLLGAHSFQATLTLPLDQTPAGTCPVLAESSWLLTAPLPHFLTCGN